MVAMPVCLHNEKTANKSISPFIVFVGDLINLDWHVEKNRKSIGICGFHEKW
jgi:hypothetical protein